MKISNDELIQLVWLNQLRRLSSGVVCVYIGDKYGLQEDSTFYYYLACRETRRRRQNVTILLEKEQLWVRLKALHKSGVLSMDGEKGAFWLDGKCPQLAWEEARQFWIDRGLLPPAFSPEPLRAGLFEELSMQCRDLLLAKFSGVYAPEVKAAE